ncbi:MAG: hypothetical protein H6985_17770 [Pseudomonadales bacterium]|nr:hypothetical protein [Halioglobus sp.]MCP5131416.1 hypothetical protein [Pseudomonadales bacterium]
MTEIFLDPTSELNAAAKPLLPRLQSLAGKTIGLLDINKPRGNVLLDRLEQLFNEQGVAVKRYKKPTMTRVAPLAVKQQIASECDAVVEALAD